MFPYIQFKHRETPQSMKDYIENICFGSALAIEYHLSLLKQSVFPGGRSNMSLYHCMQYAKYNVWQAAIWGVLTILSVWIEDAYEYCNLF